MKRYLFLSLLLSIASFISFGGDSKPAYNIKVKVKNCKPGIAKLAFYFGDKKLLKDSCEVDAKGSFEFKGTKKLEEGIYLVVLPDSRYFELIAGPNQFFSAETDTVDYVSSMIVKGSVENEQFYQYLKYINPRGKEAEKLSKEYEVLEDKKGPKAEEIRKKLTEIDKDVVDYKKSFMTNNPTALMSTVFKALEEPEVPDFKEITEEEKRRAAQYYYYRAHFFDNVNLTDERLLRTPIFEPKLMRYLQKVVTQNPDTIAKEIDKIIVKAGSNKEMFRYLVGTITNSYEKTNVMCMDEVAYHMFKKYYLNDKRVDWVDSSTRVKINEHVIKNQYNLCGEIAQNLIMKDTLGKFHSLQDLKNEYTLVYFWSATCGHCKTATPKLFETYKQIKDEYDLEIYSVCIDAELAEFKKFINTHKFTWINVFDTTDQNYFRVKYNIYSTPVLYLLDHKKEIIAKRFDVETLEKILKDRKEKGLK